MELVSADQIRSRANEPRKEGYFSIYWGLRRTRTLKTSLGPTVALPWVHTIPTWCYQSSSQWWQAEAAQGWARAWSSCPSSWSTGSARPLACPALLPAGYPDHQALQKKKKQAWVQALPGWRPPRTLQSAKESSRVDRHHGTQSLQYHSGSWSTIPGLEKSKPDREARTFM